MEHYLKRSILLGMASALFSTVSLADSINDFNDSWEGQAWKLQRQLDRNTPLSQINILGTHNSFNSEKYTTTDFDTGIRYLDPQQKRTIEDQLRMGARYLEFDAHWTPKMESLFSYPNRLLLCHGSDSHAGCSMNDRYLREGLKEIRNWLQSAEAAGEVVILYIEGHMDGHQNKALEDIETYLGDYVYQPVAVCSEIPVSLTKQMVLDAGKQVIIRDNKDRDCSSTDYAEYDEWVYTDFESGIAKKQEDSTTTDTIRDWITGESDDYISPSDIETYFSQGVDIVNLDDMVTTDDRLAAGLWSWDTNEPNDANGEDCASQKSNGRWNDMSCDKEMVFACKDADNNWSITSSSGNWSEGEAACGSLGGSYQFSYPMSSEQNQALKTIKDTAGVDKAWLNITDATHEGLWGITNGAEYSTLVGGVDGSGFDLMNVFLSDTTQRLTQLTVHSGNRLDGIDVTYDDAKSYRLGDDGGSASTLSLNDEQYINSVYICEDYSSKYDSNTVHYIKLTTNDGQNLVGGVEEGLCTTVASNACIVGFFGREGSEIDALGVLTIDEAACD